MKTLRLLPLAAALTITLAACQPADTSTTPVPEATPAAAAQADAAQAQHSAQAIELVSGTYTIDPTHTLVLAQWNHLGFSNPSANFPDASGSIVIDADNIANSSVNVTFPMANLVSFTKAFDDHLKNSDFFDVAKFPEARFVSTRIESLGGNQYKVTGDLTIKDRTQSVTLDATLNGSGAHPMNQSQTIGFDATTNIKRSDFGVDYAAPAVSDEVKLRITTEASIKADAPAQAAAASDDTAQ